MFVKDKEDLERFYCEYPLRICPICGLEFRYNHEGEKNEYVELNIDGAVRVINKADICGSFCFELCNIAINNNCSFDIAHQIWKKDIDV